MPEVIKEHFTEEDFAKATELAKGLSDSFKFSRTSTLVALSSLLLTFESLANNMLDQSATGTFENNKKGVLHPVAMMYGRLHQRKPAAGYVDLIV